MNLNIRDALTLGVPYLIAVGACYQFAYWGAFHVNALEFISITDIGKLAFYPLLATLIFLLVGVLIGHIASPNFPPGGGAESPTGIIFNRYKRWLGALLICGAVLTAIYGPEPNRWVIVSILVCPFSVALAGYERIIEVMPNRGVRSTTLYVLFLLPTMGFAEGRIQAHDIKDNRPAQFVDVVRSKLPIESDDKHPVAYLGYLGNVYILREGKTGQLVFVKQRDDSPLFLSVREK